MANATEPVGKRGGIVALLQAKLLVTVPIDFWHLTRQAGDCGADMDLGNPGAGSPLPLRSRYIGDGG